METRAAIGWMVIHPRIATGRRTNPTQRIKCVCTRNPTDSMMTKTVTNNAVTSANPTVGYHPVAKAYLEIPKGDAFFFVQRKRGCRWSSTFPICDMLIRSGDIRDQSPQLSKIADFRTIFLTSQIFGGGPSKNCTFHGCTLIFRCTFSEVFKYIAYFNFLRTEY